MCFVFLQLASLNTLELENQESANQLEAVVERGENLLHKIQDALHDIARVQLECQALEGNTAPP